VKSELTAEHFVTKLRLESRLLGIMKATNMQALEAAKLAMNEKGEMFYGFAMQVKSKISYLRDA
jgi:hypothetical protein